MLLDLLIEECAEVIQRVTKAKRFGLEEVQAGQELNNKERLRLEVRDVLEIVNMLHREGIDLYSSAAELTDKRRQVEYWLNYSKKVGALKKDKSYEEE
jgi:NTP pyrophosphatase (non-canonical NTP hydrolase)